MSYSGKQYLADRERLLEPGQLLRGTYRRHGELRTAQADKNRWLNNLTAEEREQLRLEAEMEEQKRKARYDI